MVKLIVAVAVVALLCGCNQAAPPPADTPAAAPAPAETSAPAAAPPATEAWVGKWLGPEGLFLDIGARNAAGRYPITLKDNLDTQAAYEGQPSGREITFTRAGKTETIRAGSGIETGFKYLAGKRDCLIVIAGQEGYCRD
jgi:hypothetical protein